MNQSTLSFFKKLATAAVASSSLTFTPTTSLNPCRKRKAELDTDAYKRQQYLSYHHDYDTKKRDRAFKHIWKLNNPWLCYDEEADLMWCGVCFENRYLIKNEDMGMVDGTNHFPFSHMNIIKSSTRTLLGNGTMNNLLEIKLNRPSIKDFSPATAILHWLENGQRKRHNDGPKNKDKE